MKGYRLIVPVGLLALSFACDGLRSDGHTVPPVETDCIIDSGILPASSMGDWCNAGVQGGIPSYPVGVDVTDYGAVGDGAADDTQAIQTAIAACPEGQAVSLPAGSYLTTGKITIKRSIVLRGAGPRSTYVIHNHSGIGIQIGYEDHELPTAPDVDRAGIEDLHVQTRYPFPNASGTRIYLNGVSNSWVRNIETSGYAYRGVDLNATSHCEVRDSFVRTTYEYVDWEVPDGDHGDSYGISIAGVNGLSSGNLVENNMLDWFRHSLLTTQHCINNVFAYNFSWTNWCHEQSETHCLKLHHPDYDDPSRVTSYTLMEGNSFEMAGSAAAHHTNTLLRNRAMGGGLPGITVESNMYILGNELTHKKHSWAPDNVIAGMWKENILVHGNYVTDGSGMQWDPSIDDHNIPNSFYLTSRPAWFGDLDWPPYGGDLMPGNTRRSPAEVRYWSMLHPENSPSGLQADGSGKQFVLTWNNNSTNDVDFIICRSTDNVNFHRIGHTQETSYTDTVAEAGRYHYYVRARNHLGGVNGDDLGGESEPSETLMVDAE